MKTILLIVAVWAAAGLAAGAAPLDTSTFTEIIKDVKTLSGANATTAPAQLHAVLNAPDRVRTGPLSRAELTAPDQTITRVGANTVFSFEGGNRNLDLEQGSQLFHSPKGRGGGTIKSGGAAAAVLGTTLIVVTTPHGGFKVIFLEGKGTVTLANGHTVTLQAGQLVFVLPGGDSFSPIYSFNLAKLVSSSLLVNGFTQPLSSLPLIELAIQQQQTQIASGNLTDTGIPSDTYIFLPGDPGSATDPNVAHTGVLIINPAPPGSAFPTAPQRPPHPGPSGP
jgi:hypothetical protein